MSDGPAQPEKRGITRRKAIQMGVAAFLTGGLGAGAQVIKVSSPPPVETPSEPEKRDPILEQLSIFKSILFSEINQEGGNRLFEELDNLEHKSPNEIAEHFRVEERTSSRGVSKRFDYSFNGLEDSFYDVLGYIETDSEGKFQGYSVQLNVDENGDIRAANENKSGRIEPLRHNELLTAARKIIKNAPETNQWVVGDGDIEGNGRPPDSIFVNLRSEKHSKEILIDDNGNVFISYSNLDEP